MNIFISWSGDTSKEIAEQLKDWIPTVLQSAKPYYTPSDIEKGQSWDTEINKKLTECLVGLICLTKDNTEKPWMLFEAGALSNRLEKSKVCPILFGIKKSEVTGPLSRFQLTDFSKEDIFKLVKSINSSMEGNAIDLNLLTITFNAFFPEFETKINVILEKEKPATSKPKRTDRSILEEILDLSRKQNNTLQHSFTRDLVTTKLGTTGYRQSSPTFQINNSFTEGDTLFHAEYGAGIVKKIVGMKDNVQTISATFLDGETYIVSNLENIIKLK